MLGLVLEGGGAKGAFHIGAIKALIEHGYVFDGVMGTSIGGLNGVMIAQGDFDQAYEIWNTLTPSMLFDVDDEEMVKYMTKQTDSKTYKYMLNLVRSTIKNKGLGVDKILEFMKKYIDEDKLRASSIDFGIITVRIEDGVFEPLEVFKEEIPYGKVSDYIMASAYYPAFRNEPLSGKRYIDGGVYDNLPINPLIRRGYDHIIAIRTMSTMPSQKVVDKTVKIDYINPSEPLGDTLAFTHHIATKNLQLGYYDALRFIHKYSGRHFYVYNEGDEALWRFMDSIPHSVLVEARNLLGLKPSATDTELMKAFMSRLAKLFKISTECSDYEKLVIAMEYVARKYKLEKFKIYTFDEFLNAIIANHTPLEERKSDFKKRVSRFFDRDIEYIFNSYLDCMVNKKLENDNE